MGVKFALCIFSHCSKSIEKQIKKERSWVGWFVLNQCVVANLDASISSTTPTSNVPQT